MILGDICTRACKFCATKTGKPLPPDPEEPLRLAESIKKMKLKHCVITSVDRDDLPDGGASFWAETIKRIKEVNPGYNIETLIPDFDGKRENIQKIIDAGPDVISHNIETVRRLTPVIRTKAKYERSLDVIRYISGKGKIAKSGFMLGLGENEDEIIQTIRDLYDSRLQNSYNRTISSARHLITWKWLNIFPLRSLKSTGLLSLEMGFSFVESSPLVGHLFMQKNM